MRTAKYVKDLTIFDPDTGAPVEVTVFKHSSGGMFALDASFIDQVLMDKLIILDPFFTENTEQKEGDEYFCELTYPETGKEIITPEEIVEFNRIKKALDLSPEFIEMIVNNIDKWSRLVELAPRHQSMLNYIKKRE